MIELYVGRNEAANTSKDLCLLETEKNRTLKVSKSNQQIVAFMMLFPTSSRFKKGYLEL